MYKKLLFLALALTGGAEARTLSQIKQTGALKIITNAEYEPFEYLKDGQPAGFEIELGNEIAKRLGVKAEWTNRPFAVLLDEAQYLTG